MLRNVVFLFVDWQIQKLFQHQSNNRTSSAIPFASFQSSMHSCNPSAHLSHGQALPVHLHPSKPAYTTHPVQVHHTSTPCPASLQMHHLNHGQALPGHLHHIRPACIAHPAQVYHTSTPCTALPHLFYHPSLVCTAPSQVHTRPK